MNDSETRRERTVDAVLARIASAPAPRARDLDAIEFIDIVTWTRPALVAASVVIVVSAALLARAPQQRTAPATIAQSIGVTPPISAFLSDGSVDTWNWLNQLEEHH